MKLIKILMACVLSLGMARFAGAVGNAGANPFEFLFLDANARSVAMGGAYSALATDSNALLYNPAGLGLVNRDEATFMHNSYFQSVNQEYLGLAFKQGFGFNINFLKFADTARTTYANPNSTLGTFAMNDLALSGGYGRVVMPNLSVGGALKYIHEKIDNQSANAVALDIGAMYSVPMVRGLTTSLSLQNIGPDVKYRNVGYSGPREHLPYNTRLGAAYAFSVLGLANTVGLDLSKTRSMNTVVGVGVESVIYKMFALRLGFNNRNSADIGLSGGIGWMNDDYAIDYAVAPYGALGFSHRVSGTVRWGSVSDRAAK